MHDFFDTIKFIIQDEDSTEFRDLGTAYTDFATLCFNCGDDRWFDIFKGQKEIGEIRIISSYVPPAGTWNPLTAEKDMGSSKSGKDEDEFAVADNKLIPLDLTNAARNGDLGISDKAIVNTLTSHQSKYVAKVGGGTELTYMFKQPVLVRGYGFRAAENPDNLPSEW